MEYEEVVSLLLVVAVSVWPLIGSAGMAIGRMQEQDRRDRERDND